MSDIYDVAVIGTGPGGLEAALTLKSRNKRVLLLGNKNLSQKVEKAHIIYNYLGLPAIPGDQLKTRFAEHLRVSGLEITEELVTAVYPLGETFGLVTKANKTYKASAVIIAMGINFDGLFDGEDTFLGRGVSYCATCDGPLYKGKTVAVIGYSKEDEAEARFLAEICEKVYYVPMYKETPDTADVDNLVIIRDTPVGIEGNMKADKLILKNSDFAVDGIFILRATIPPTQLISSLELDGAHIKVNRAMQTNIPGCFACGDITGKPYQYIKAAGEGNVAAISAVAYIDELKKKEA